MSDLREVAEKYKEQLSQIKIALFDCDGILTDGSLFYQGSEVGFNRFFNARDGYGLKLLMQAGLRVGVISGGDSLGLNKRIENLGLDFSYLGSEDKRHAYLEIKEKTEAKDSEILYMGDEFFDMPLIQKAGFGVSVPEASYEVKECADYVTSRAGGHGAAREVVDLIRYAIGFTPKIADF